MSNQYNRFIEERKPKSEFNVKTLKEGQNYLIIDSAGMGKSTFAKHLVLEILDLTNKIPIFLELRRIAESESLLEKIASEIDETKKDVNEELLLKLLNEDEFVIILDGYDEIPDQFRNEIGQQISELSIKFENNSIILTSRPEVNIPEILQSTVLKIKPLNKEQAKSLLLRYDSIANIDVGKKLIEQFDRVKKEFLETPLLVVLLYRTYGFNQSIATRISSFYDEVYNALYKGHDLTKSGFARQKASRLDSEDFRRLLRGFSFLLIIQRKENLKSRSEAIRVIDEAAKLTSVNPISSSDFFDDLLLSVPLFTKEGTEFRFIHKSFGEFFSAEFLSYYPKSEQIIKNLNESVLAKSLVNTFEFISDINPSLFKREIVLPLAKEILKKINLYPNIILTTKLIGIFKIGLWDKDLYTEKSPDGRNNITIPRLMPSTWYFYGKVKDKNFILAIGNSHIKKYPPSIWNFIANLNNWKLTRTELDFDPISDIPINVWLDLENNFVLRNINNDVIKMAIKSVIESEQELPIENRLYKVAIIDENRCKEVIKDVDQESETQNWLENLISE